ncbi:hypothetical protein J6590_005666 [Homalodisca vitripennis]|nr:hypothetical protein J6590_005666 [Homalodisca vitripennis]
MNGPTKVIRNLDIHRRAISKENNVRNNDKTDEILSAQEETTNMLFVKLLKYNYNQTLIFKIVNEDHNNLYRRPHSTETCRDTPECEGNYSKDNSSTSIESNKSFREIFTL